MTSEDDDLDWFERIDRWADRFGWRIAAALALLVGIVVLVRQSPETERISAANSAREGAAIGRHMAWLRSLPETAKRTWPIASFCHPASAPYGKCECDGESWNSVVGWPERLENGDIACHAQK